MTTTTDLLGPHHVARMSQERRFAMDGYTAAPPGHRILALLELDVTEAQAQVAAAQARGERTSLFAFVVACIARALAEHRALNAVRVGYDVCTFEDVDINIPVEVKRGDGAVTPHQLVIRKAHEKSAAAIYAEIEGARAENARSGALGEEDRKTARWMRLAALLPRFLRVLVIRRMMASFTTVKRAAGTTFVTSVGKMASVPGFVIPLTASPMASTFALGSVVEKPAVRDGRIEPRSFLALTIVLDHDVVDGAPAARFAKRLQELVEGGRPDRPA